MPALLIILLVVIVIAAFAVYLRSRRRGRLLLSRPDAPNQRPSGGGS